MLCQQLDVAVLPYGYAWWLLGNRINQVVGELAGLSESSLRQLQRPGFARDRGAFTVTGRPLRSLSLTANTP